MSSLRNPKPKNIMNSKTIIASLGLLSLACTAQAASSDPWEYYRMGGDYRSAYTTRYDSTFGGSIKGVYAWASEEIAPDMYGFQIDLHANIETGSVFHELSINSGLLYGSKTYFGLLKFETMSVPLMAGYSLNVPLSEIATFYIGGKAGIAFDSARITIGGNKISDNATEFAYSALIGFKLAISEKTDIVIGYEMYKIEDDRPYHAITMGFSWSF